MVFDFSFITGRLLVLNPTIGSGADNCPALREFSVLLPETGVAARIPRSE